MEIQKKVYNDISYAVCGETWYPGDLDEDVIHALQRAEKADMRVRIFYGETKLASASCPYGTVWPEIYHVTGYISHSCGNVKIPLLLANSTSIGGDAILCGCILKIVDIKSKTVLYENPAITFPPFFAVGVAVYRGKDCEEKMFQTSKEASAFMKQLPAPTPDCRERWYVNPTNPCCVCRCVLEDIPSFDFSHRRNGERRAANMVDFLMGKRFSC